MRRVSMSDVLTQDIIEKCDSLWSECDIVHHSAEFVDAEITRLTSTAAVATVQISILACEQSKVAENIRALSWRFFWSNLHPSVILTWIKSALGIKYKRSQSLSHL